MAFNMNLWKVDGNDLSEINTATLDKEERLENWITKDPSILGVDLLLIGRQVTSEYRGRIDLLAINSQGDLVIIELKRDRSPREVVAQVLDYASWIKKLVYNDINAIIKQYLNKSLAEAFNEKFGTTIPENINVNHSMIIVASELDDSSERIVQYLSDDYNVNINAIFFNYFKSGSDEIIGRAWLMDPEEVQERAESRKQAPWSGYWFVNVGEGERRNWEDNRRYGYIGAGHGKWYSDRLKKLDVGDKIFAYQKGYGYVGYGDVTKRAVMLKDFFVEKEGKPLLELPLKAPKATDYLDNPEMAEWAVGVNWIKTFPMEECKYFKGLFANQNIVCKLRDQKTVDFLIREFGISDS